MGQPQRDQTVRFWEKVNKTGDCWLWTGGCTRRGYGTFRTHPRGLALAHRFAYALTYGPIDPGMEIDHRTTCPKGCVRPDHLRAVTHKQNQENRKGAGQSNNRSSGLRGVTWDRGMRKWKAQVRHNNRNHNVGFFESAEEASLAAREERMKLFTHNDADRLTQP